MVYLPIQDQESYIRSHGIEATAAAPTADEKEDATRIEVESDYQASLHKSFFGLDPGDKKRDQFLCDLKCKNLMVSLKAADGLITDIPLYPLARSCETVLVFVSSESWFSNVGTNCELSFLEEFKCSTIRQFLSVITTRCTVEEILEDQIISCCRLAHFLQCSVILDKIVEIIRNSIDSKNCTMICHFASHLQIPSLLESSISHMTNALDDIKNNDEWDYLPSSLQSQIITMRNVAHSSIIGRGIRGKIFFSSAEEFLAIFFDSIRDQKERLDEGRLRLQEVKQERIMGGHLMTGEIQDNEIKLLSQEKRIRTLEVFYKEQKEIFGNGVSLNHLL